MLYYGLDEQARHEDMPDEYKDRYIIQCRRNHIPVLLGGHKITTWFTYRTELEDNLIRHN